MKNVYHDLSTSPFSYKVDDFLFIFSSKLYLDKFIKNNVDYVREETLKLTIKYGLILYPKDMFLLSFYKKVEKRGFKVYYKGCELEKNTYIDFILNLEYSKIRED